MKQISSKLVCGLSTRVSITEYDKLSGVATQGGVSIARFLRDIIRRELACRNS